MFGMKLANKESTLITFLPLKNYLKWKKNYYSPLTAKSFVGSRKTSTK